MKNCNKCGAQLDDKSIFCPNCGSKIEENNIKETKVTPEKKINKIIIALAIIIVLVFGGVILFKDDIMYNYYTMKGDKENSINVSIEYYIEALKVKYSSDIIDKINDKIKLDENFESTLSNLKGIVKDSDLNNLYIKAYVNKAKENFNNKNYETTWKYLAKAENYNYNTKTFEYYSDLMAVQNEKDKPDVTQNISVYNNQQPVYNGDLYDYYIIPDSDIRYLTVEVLSSYDRETLGYIRNEIYARHGYIFKTEKYRQYFGSMLWYFPNQYVKGDFSYLNDVEKYNVELIKSLE
ncbi:YARHG domain-containing protein [Romboutsia sp.]|uniref:YARHG domain-containing protein n=1 Tax=Romboutsia sp. TaxID=1965302 RepID=UPI003F363466